MDYFFKLYLMFSGRITRSDYWLAYIPIYLLGFFLKTSGSQDWLLVLVWPALAISAKRWHDRDKSGWWNLIIFVPLLGTLWTLIECGFLPGTNGPNRFGENPLQNKSC
ncbi:MAG: DUF805 domain-containing protein [bacterium]